MKFSEKKFIETVVTSKPNMGINQEELKLLFELETPSGIPDVVILRKKDFKLLRKFKNQFPNVDFTNGHAKIIACLFNRKLVDIEEIKRATGLSSEYLGKHIRILENEEIIKRGFRNKQKVKLSQNIPISRIELWSLEFKINAWKSALRQAVRYRAFSSKVCIVMPVERREILKRNSDVFRKFGIGVAVFDPKTNNLQYIVKPQKTEAIVKNLYLDALGRIATQVAH